MLNLIKNFIFSSTLGFKNFEYRISKIFYQRFILDISLKILSMIPHLLVFYTYIAFSSEWAQYKEIMLAKNQNINGYVNMIIGVFILMLIVSTLLVNIILSLVKLGIPKKDFTEIEEIEKNKVLTYVERVKNSTLNMWYVAFELLLIVYVIWTVINLYVGVNLTFMSVASKVIPSILIAGITSLVISLIISIRK